MEIASKPHPSLKNVRGESVLRTLLYFDIFGHPLTANEIVRYTPVSALTADAVTSLCRGPALRDLVKEQDGYFFLRNSERSSVQGRLEREANAERLWPIARLMARIIIRFPFVRGVFVSGELSKGVAGPDSDIDFVVLTAERRMWIARTLLIAFKKGFLLNRRRYFCLNHFQTIGHLAYALRSYYAAVEIVTLRPMSVPNPHPAYLASNEWIAEVLPNAIRPAPSVSLTQDGPLMRRVLEACFPTRAADLLDDRLRKWWQRLWDRRYPTLASDDRAYRFACTPTLSTAYGTDIAQRIGSAWSERLESFGLSSAPKEAA